MTKNPFDFITAFALCRYLYWSFYNQYSNIGNPYLYPAFSCFWLWLVFPKKEFKQVKGFFK